MFRQLYACVFLSLNRKICRSNWLVVSKALLKQRVGANVILKSKASVTLNSGVYRTKVGFNGTTFSIYLNDNRLSATPTTTSPFGKFGFRLKGQSAVNGWVTFDIVLIQ